MKRVDIIIFGDSITYGAWDKEKGGWVNRLRLAYETMYPEDRYTIFNLGISGEIAKEINQRFTSECSSRFNSENTSLIVFALGINDSQDDNNKDRTPLNDFKEEITSLIKNAKQFTNNILFIGLTKVDETKVTPIPWHLEKYYFNHKVKQYDQAIQKICDMQQVQYLYVYDTLDNDDLSDGLHPNEIGHQKLCDIIKSKIDTLI